MMTPAAFAASLQQPPLRPTATTAGQRIEQRSQLVAPASDSHSSHSHQSTGPISYRHHPQRRATHVLDGRTGLGRAGRADHRQKCLRPGDHRRGNPLAARHGRGDGPDARSTRRRSQSRSRRRSASRASLAHARAASAMIDSRERTSGYRRRDEAVCAYAAASERDRAGGVHAKRKRSLMARWPWEVGSWQRIARAAEVASGVRVRDVELGHLE